VAQGGESPPIHAERWELFARGKRRNRGKTGKGCAGREKKVHCPCKLRAKREQSKNTFKSFTGEKRNLNAVYKKLGVSKKKENPGDRPQGEGLEPGGSTWGQGGSSYKKREAPSRKTKNEEKEIKSKGRGGRGRTPKEVNQGDGNSHTSCLKGRRKGKERGKKKKKKKIFGCREKGGKGGEKGRGEAKWPRNNLKKLFATRRKGKSAARMSAKKMPQHPCRGKKEAPSALTKDQGG